MEKKSLTLNSVFYLLYNALNVIFPFITGIYVTHVLLPDSIGNVETARNLAQYFFIFSCIGIPTYAVREIAKHREEKEQLNKLYTELMTINFISTIIFSMIYLSIVFLVPSYRHNYQLFLLSGLIVFCNIFFNSWLYEGLEEFKYIALRNLIFKIITFVSLVLFVKGESDICVYAFIVSFGTIGNYIFNILHSRKFVRFKFSQLDLKRHLKPILYLSVVNLAIEIYTLLDITMLSHMTDSQTVAYYSYGQKIYRIFIQIINTFTIVLVPRISLLYKENNYIEYNRLLNKTLKILIILAIPIIIGLFFVSDYVITKIYGDSYIRSSQVLKILSFILLLAPVGYLLGSRVLLISGNEKKMMIPVCFGAIVNFSLNLVLIRFYKEIGASISSVVGEFFVMFIYILLGRKFYNLDYKNFFLSVIKIIFSALIMILVLILINIIVSNELTEVIISIISAMILYFGVLLLLREDVILNFTKKILRRI